MENILLHLNRYKSINNKLININSYKNKIPKQRNTNKKKPTKNSGRGTAIIIMEKPWCFAALHSATV